MPALTFTNEDGEGGKLSAIGSFNLDELKRTLEHEREKNVELITKIEELESQSLKDMSQRNKEFNHLQSQLTKYRCDFEKSEMLRQTLEYELTVMRSQCGKESFKYEELEQILEKTKKLFSDKLNEMNGEIDRLRTELTSTVQKYEYESQRLGNDLKEKDERIYKLQATADTHYERERRIITLNEQIERLEKTFAESEQISRKYLADAVQAKDKEIDMKREYDILFMKLQFYEQTLDNERTIANEAKLTAELMSSRVKDLDTTVELMKQAKMNDEHKIEQLQKQISNEKLLRTTLNHLQKDLEEKCLEMNIAEQSYEKTIKSLRDELANCRRKVRLTEDKHSYCNAKVVDLLKFCKIISDTPDQNNSTTTFVPSSKQLEDLRLYVDNLRKSSNEKVNEIARLKKSVERLTKSSISQHRTQLEHVQSKEDVLNQMLAIKDELESCKYDKVMLEELLMVTKTELQQLDKQYQQLYQQNLEMKMFIQQKLNDSNKTQGEVVNLSLLESIHDRLQMAIRSSSHDTNNTNGQQLVIHQNNDLCSVVNDELKIILSRYESLMNSSQQLEQQLNTRETEYNRLQQTMEEQLLGLKTDISQRDEKFSKQKEMLITHYEMTMQELQTNLKNAELKSLESLHRNQLLESEHLEKKRSYEKSQSVIDEKDSEMKQFKLLSTFLVGLIYPLKQRYTLLIRQMHILKQFYANYQEVKQSIIQSSNTIPKIPPILRFRKYAIAIIAYNRLLLSSKKKKFLLINDEQYYHGKTRLNYVYRLPNSKQNLHYADCDTLSQEPSSFLNDEKFDYLKEAIEHFQISPNKTKSTGQFQQRALKSSLMSLLCKLDGLYDDDDGELNGSSNNSNSRSVSIIQLISRGLGKHINGTKSKGSCVSVQDLVQDLTLRTRESDADNKLLKLQLHSCSRDSDELKQCRLTVKKLEKQVKSNQKQNESMIPFEQFEAIYKELESALSREKQAQSILNEQNQQLQQITDILNDTQTARDQSVRELTNKEQIISSLKQRAHDLQQINLQMDANLQRAENAIRLVFKDKEELQSYCQYVSSILTKATTDMVQNRKYKQLTNFLQSIVQKQLGHSENKISFEIDSCQMMTNLFVSLLRQLIEKLAMFEDEILALKRHAQVLTDNFKSAPQLTRENTFIQNEANQLESSSPEIVPTKDTTSRHSSSSSFIQDSKRDSIELTKNRAVLSTVRLGSAEYSAFKPIRPDSSTSSIVTNN
ncbi:unnamed protein product [Didymodactylos carnosus]|uniref:Uncharacterized protein n=1 Tax=Didymodactylos carnosus TaxID=1234261 RepID=A0A814LFP9_9BILA|nr:unnamed protein product [Didymodactylos carnosus]CAF1064374.1 unnamed protein product [Didymodactylos carnosus]CAF3642093.1 unnamed protein product [Didymodactylos carnosus]CAF3832270.1 unnamed protein product [Didymodactylos carnosus]